MRTRTIAAAAGVLLLTGVAGCGSSDKGSTPDVSVRMSEWLWEPSVSTVKAGDVVIEANNVGGAEHEVIVVAGSDPKAFATKADGSIDEEKIDEAAKMGEIEHVAASSTKNGTFALMPGTYVVMCNLVDAAGNAHFAKGMVTTLTVT